MESCDETGDQCVSSGDPCPDDGLFCTGDEYCLEAYDTCWQSGDPCIDGSDCTDDICDDGSDTCDNPCAATGPSDPCCADAACVGDPICAAEFILELDGSYSGGTLYLNYTLKLPESATWSNYLILTSPSVQVIPLFSVPLPPIPIEYSLPLSFPFPSLGTIGIYSGLFTAGGPQAVALEWVVTGK